MLPFDVVQPTHAPAVNSGLRRLLHISAGIGAVLWLLLRLVPNVHSDPVHRVLLGGILVAAPLALAPLASRSGSRAWRALLQAAAGLQPLAALAAVGSFLVAAPVAGALAAPWLGFLGLLGLLGLLRLARGAWRTPAEASIAAGLLFAPVGGFWLVAAQLDLTAFGFDPLIVVLTAVHFHYAGLAAPVLTGLALGRLVELGMRRALAWPIAGGVILGIPLVAAGIAVAPVLGLVGAVLLAAALAGLAVTSLSHLRAFFARRLSAWLLAVSCLSVLLSMPLAVLWAWGQVTGTAPIELIWMVRIHGMANAHGFVLCGLVAWALEPARRLPPGRGSQLEEADDLVGDPIE